MTVNFVSSTMNAFITKTRRQELIAEFLDCYEETGGEDTAAEQAKLQAMNNSELVSYVQAAGWGIV